MRTFPVIVADFPWPSALGHRMAPTYDLMSEEAIRAVQLPAAKNCVLFLWRLNCEDMIELAYRTVRAFGFKPKAELRWEKLTNPKNPKKVPKRQFGPGVYVHNDSETCIIATRGSAVPRVRDQRASFQARMTGHSRKPDEFFSIVERMYEGPYLELFARQPRPGWVCVGRDLGTEIVPGQPIDV